MIDFHNHILPGIDDGSRSLEESAALLKALSEQGVTVSVATPHFNVNRESIGSFLNRRNDSYRRLIEKLPAGSPRILCGAEVAYYNGISRLPDLHKLCVEGSRLLLLEMPVSKWTEYTVKELLELAGSNRLTVVLAHMERYMNFQRRDTVQRLYESGVLMQFNAGFFLGLLTKRRAIRMIRNGEIHFIGSDCHNLTSRRPRIGDAFEVIKNRLGEGFISQFDEYGRSVLALHA